jgi:hypothetical protein
MDKKILVFLVIGFFCLGILMLIYFNPFNWVEDDFKYYKSSLTSSNEINIDQSKSTIFQYFDNPELEYFNVSLDNGLKISYRGYAITYQPVFVMQNDNTFKWGEIPTTIGKDLWKTQIAGNKYKWGVDFSNVSTNIRNNLKWVILNRTNATKEVWNNITNTTDIVPMTLHDIEERITINGNTIILNNKVFLSHDDILSTYNIPVINRSMIVIGGLNNNWTVCDDWNENIECNESHVEYNWIDNGDGTWNISFDPIITIDEANWITTSLLTNVTAESGDTNFTHLNISDSAPYDSLVGYWNFDGDNVDTTGSTAYDWSSSNNDGTMQSDAVVNSSDCAPNFGNCLQLDGAGDDVQVTRNAGLEPGNITVSVWTYDKIGGVGERNVIHKDRNTDAVGYQIRSDGGNIQWIVGNAGGTSGASSSQPATDSWHHIVGTYNGSVNVLYIDGSQVASASLISGDITYTTGNLILGQHNAGANWNGLIDEVMIFNTVLNSTQITDLYDNQSARFLSTGTQDLNDQSVLNISTGSNRVNVSTTIQENFDSDVNLTVGYYDGSWSATTPQIVVSGVNLTFEISGTSTNLTLNYSFVAGNSTSNPFYSPIIQGDITLETFAVPTIEIDLISPPNLNDVNVTQNEFFNVTVNVTCRLADCGEVNVSLDPKVETFTPTTDTVCENGICNKILYSGIRNVYEDNEWKKVENARSLKDKGFDVVINSDGVHNVEVLDFNISFIEFNFSFDPDNLGEYDYEYEDGKLKTKFKILEYNDTGDLVETEYDIEVEEGGLNYVYDGNPLGKEFHFGDESTTIKLQNNVTENLNDAYVYEDSPDTNYGSVFNTLFGMSSTSGHDRICYYMFNISSIPSSVSIIESVFVSDLYVNGLDAAAEGYNGSFYRVDDSWNESGITWNNKPSHLGPPNSTFKFFGGTGEPVGWIPFDLTDIVSYHYSLNRNNVSFALVPSDVFGTPSSSDYVRFYSKDGANQLLNPYLNITYNDPAAPKSGLISDTIGDVPYYTNESNPRNITLNKDQSQLVTFWVNATGDADVTSIFYAFVNQTANTSISNETGKWNVTITSDEDNTPPTWSNNQTNTTIAGTSINFSLQVNDDVALHPKGQYIFSTNNSGGTWTNDSAVNFTGTPASINVIKTLNDTTGVSVGWRLYLTDNAGNLNITDTFELTTTSAVDTSFTVTLPDNTVEAIYTALNKSHKNVAPTNQTDSVPFFNITNIGNVNLDFNMFLNVSLPASIDLKGDTDNNPTGAIPINDSSVNVYSTLTPSSSFSFWFWTDFTDALEQTIARQLNVTTEQS